MGHRKPLQIKVLWRTVRPLSEFAPGLHWVPPVSVTGHDAVLEALANGLRHLSPEDRDKLLTILDRK